MNSWPESKAKNLLKRILPGRAISFRRRVANYVRNKPRFSYSYGGEDLLISQLLPPDIDFGSVRYIDIGCENPIIANNTYRLYRQGARGICVDARKELKMIYRIFRRRDLFLSYIVTDGDTQSQSLDFFVNPDDPHVSSVDKNWAKGNLSLEISPRKVRTTSLKDIVISNRSRIGEPQALFTILSIDTESHDLNVLKSNDWAIFQPDVICIKSNTYGNLNNHLTSEIHLFLIDANYLFASTNGLSAIYKKG